ncbi:MAG: transposase [Candidatus Cloacimonas sp.]|jgi:hypothetical protein|nr:transposase [Candidatus Cloacimonas sp.]
MKPLSRLFTAVIMMLVFIILFCFVWLQSWIIQVAGLLGVIAIAALLFKPKKLGRELLLLAPFVLLLAVIYAIFAIFKIAGSTAYWIHYGLSRTALLLSTILFMHVLISRIKIDDFLFLPWGIQKLKYIILGKLLYSLSFKSYPIMCMFTELIPSEQVSKPKMRERIRSRLISLLALISLIIGESSLKGQMIDACIQHCYPKEQK